MWSVECRVESVECKVHEPYSVECGVSSVECKG